MLLVSLGAVMVGGGACSSSNTTTTSPTPPAASSHAATAASPTTAAGGGPISTVSVNAREYAYDAPDTIPAGLTRIRMQNVGQEDHQAQLLKLNAGVTLPQFQAALQKGPDAALSIATAEGGPNAEKAGQASEAVQNLQPGQYVFLCFVPAPDGVPHLAKGMIKPVQVTAASPAPTAQLPSASNTVTGRDFLFEGLTTLPAGQATITFKNAGTQPHEMTVVKLNPGVTLDQLKAALSSSAPPAGPPPFTSEGGMGGISPGETGQTTVNLTAGTYALICNIPDPTSGKPHVALGMMSGFSVR
jgi:plastocyanin